MWWCWSVWPIVLTRKVWSKASAPLVPPPPPSVLRRTDVGNPHTTADASYTCTHKGMCNKMWNVMWHDHGNFEEHLQGLQSFQHYSHLPGLSFFARKVTGSMLCSRLWILLDRYRGSLPLSLCVLRSAREGQTVHHARHVPRNLPRGASSVPPRCTLGKRVPTKGSCSQHGCYRPSIT